MELTQDTATFSPGGKYILFMWNSYKTFLGMQISAIVEASEPHEINPFWHNHTKLVTDKPGNECVAGLHITCKAKQIVSSIILDYQNTLQQRHWFSVKWSTVILLALMEQIKLTHLLMRKM